MKKSIISALVATSALTMTSGAIGSEVLVHSHAEIKPFFGLGHIKSPLQEEFNLDLFLNSRVKSVERAIQINNDAAIARALHELELEEQAQINNDAAIARALHELELEEQAQINNDAAIARALMNNFKIENSLEVKKPVEKKSAREVHLDQIHKGVSLKKTKTTEKEYDFKADYLAEKKSQESVPQVQENFKSDLDAQEELKPIARGDLFDEINKGGFKLNKVQINAERPENPQANLMAQIRGGISLTHVETLVKKVKKNPHLEAIHKGVELKKVGQSGDAEESNIPPAPDFRKIFKIDSGSDVDQDRMGHHQNRGDLLGQIALGTKLKSVNGDVQEEKRLAAQRERDHAKAYEAKFQKALEQIQAEKDAKADKENDAKKNAVTNALREQKIAEENIRNGLLPNGQKRQPGNILADISNFSLKNLRPAEDRVLQPLTGKEKADQDLKHHCVFRKE